MIKINLDLLLPDLSINFGTIITQSGQGKKRPITVRIQESGVRSYQGLVSLFTLLKRLLLSPNSLTILTPVFWLLNSYLLPILVIEGNTTV